MEFKWRRVENGLYRCSPIPGVEVDIHQLDKREWGWWIGRYGKIVDSNERRIFSLPDCKEKAELAVRRLVGSLGDHSYLDDVEVMPGVVEWCENRSKTHGMTFQRGVVAEMGWAFMGFLDLLLDEGFGDANQIERDRQEVEKMLLRYGLGKRQDVEQESPR